MNEEELDRRRQKRDKAPLPTNSRMPLWAPSPERRSASASPAPPKRKAPVRREESGKYYRITLIPPPYETLEVHIYETRKDIATKTSPIDSPGRDLLKFNILKCKFILVSKLRIFEVHNRGGLKSEVIQKQEFGIFTSFSEIKFGFAFNI